MMGGGGGGGGGGLTSNIDGRWEARLVGGGLKNGGMWDIGPTNRLERGCCHTPSII